MFPAVLCNGSYRMYSVDNQFIFKYEILALTMTDAIGYSVKLFFSTALQSLTLPTAAMVLPWILLETLNWLVCSESNIIQYIGVELLL